MLAGVSTVGVVVSYGIETTAGTKPATFTKLNRISSIGAIDLSTEKIDASALEDKVSAYIEGRQDTGGTFDIQVNLTDDTITEWETFISASESATAASKSAWIQVTVPNLTKSFFIVAQPPSAIPMPEIAQNGVLVGTMSCTVNQYKGLDTKVAPAA